MPVNQIRPNIPSIKMTADMSPEEIFQNDTIRPIIKMKHDLFIEYLRDYLKTKKNPLSGLSKEKQVNYLESVFRQDSNFRSELRGVVLGQLTVAEYLQYITIKNQSNKRMINIIAKRMIDHLDMLCK